MADALVSPLVAGAAGTISATLVAVAVKKVKENTTENLIPLMGVMGAFIFAAQMINFSIPGTGSSGHIAGGILLSALLGPWAGFITLTSVLIIQCLLFADGGLMALGCNILNMAVFSCLIVYPLIFKPLMKYPASTGKITRASLLACTAGLALGALAVTLETELSGITALPIGRFLLFMLPIHLVIGIGEGLATAAILSFIGKYKPELLSQFRATRQAPSGKLKPGKVLAVFILSAALMGGTFHWIASSDPDGLEWSVLKLTGETELPAQNPSGAYDIARDLQQKTALMPDYNTTFAGLAGGGIFVLFTWGISELVRHKKKNTRRQNE